MTPEEHREHKEYEYKMRDLELRDRNHRDWIRLIEYLIKIIIITGLGIMAMIALMALCVMGFFS